MAAYRSIEQAKANGISPVSLTGVAQIHKAQLLVTLCQSGTVLAVTGDEAEAKRLCDDINAMEQAQTAVLFPSKELLVTAVEGVSAEYEHARLAAVTALQQGISRVVIASMEALMQPTIPPEQLQKETIRLRQGCSQSDRTDSASDGNGLCPWGIRRRRRAVCGSGRHHRFIPGSVVCSGSNGAVG